MGKSKKRGASKPEIIHSPEKVNDGIGYLSDSKGLPSGRDLKRSASKSEISSSPDKTSTTPSLSRTNKKLKISAGDEEIGFVGDPFSSVEAKKKWPNRYQCKNKYFVESGGSKGYDEEKKVLQASQHYRKSIVDGVVFNLFDDAYTMAEEGKSHYIARIVEMFKTVDNQLYVTTRWFYRAEDTVIKGQALLIDTRRVFLSDIADDNPLDCIVSKVKIVQLSPKMDPADKELALASSDLYFDMTYSLKYLTFRTADEAILNVESQASMAREHSFHDLSVEKKIDAVNSENGGQAHEMTLLDVYSGCGALSSGLCLGASLGGLKLNHRWAIDFNSDACESLKTNHPETKVRNEGAEDFLYLLKEWEKLCKEFQIWESTDVNSGEDSSVEDSDLHAEEDGALQSEEFEVKRLLAVCYGDPNKSKERGLYFKVSWKGYGPSHDTWEPVDGLRNCKGSLKEFVTAGYHAKLLPLPGDVDFLCGGPPCQGVSGFNRFRDAGDPLKDIKNQQIEVFMNMIEFLRPKYVLMENVADILKFSGGTYACYAIGRLVSLSYQTRLGIMAAGAYGVAQCRMRVFLWASQPTERLPHFPLPTHEVFKKGVVLNEFKDIVVRHEDDQSCKLEKCVLLGDVISDLPAVKNEEEADAMSYSTNPLTDFQKYIRLKKKDIFRYVESEGKDSEQMLYDHKPLKLNPDDYERVCRVPKREGANFRDLPGLLFDSNKVQLDSSVVRPLCKSGKPLVPDYALRFEDGKSSKPFGRLGMDDIVATVVTRAQPHNQAILHLEQDRVLTVRENARLQGFPDCYRLTGDVKERYKQVGNAVCFSVSIPLGYALARAKAGETQDKPFQLPFKFPNCLGQLKNIKKLKNGNVNHSKKQ